MNKIIFAAVILLQTVSVMAAPSLKIGLLPIEDSVPFYLAEQERMFARENLAVELIPFQSALERDSALAAKAIDGAIDDPIGAILFDKGEGRLKITSLCLGEHPAEGPFAILASPGSKLKSVKDLRGVEIAVSKSTIIEYVTDRLLAEHGFATADMKKLEVVKMPIRMQMLLSDTVKAATLPEPLASIAIGKGARILASDAESPVSLSQTVIVFRSEVLNQRRMEVAAFFRAYGSAVQALNTDSERFRALFIDKGRIPPFLAATYPIPRYPLPQPFSAELYRPVIEWLVAKQLSASLPYATMWPPIS